MAFTTSSSAIRAQLAEPAVGGRARPVRHPPFRQGRLPRRAGSPTAGAPRRLAAELPDDVDITTFRTDLFDPAQLVAAVAAIEARFGHVDVAVWSPGSPDQPRARTTSATAPCHAVAGQRRGRPPCRPGHHRPLRPGRAAAPSSASVTRPPRHRSPDYFVVGVRGVLGRPDLRHLPVAGDAVLPVGAHPERGVGEAHARDGRRQLVRPEPNSSTGSPTAVVCGGTNSSSGTTARACTSAPTATHAPAPTTACCNTVACAAR